MAAASSPLHMPPKSAISLARARPTSRGSSQEAPLSSDRPRLAKIMESLARSLQTTRSQPSASDSPAPTATPSTLAMVGLETWCRAEGHVPEAPHARQARAGGVGGRAAGVREVGARAEGAARPRQHHDPVVGVVLHLLEGGAQLGQHLAVGGVLALGTVHRDGHDTVLALDNQCLHGHGP